MFFELCRLVTVAAAALVAFHVHRPQEAQQQLRQEKQQHQQLAGSLLEHAGRLSHKYYNLSDDYDALEHRSAQPTSVDGIGAGEAGAAHQA